MFEAKGVIVKQGNRLKYETVDGEELLEYRKNWSGELLDKVMSDYLIKEASMVNTDEADEEAAEHNFDEEIVPNE